MRHGDNVVARVRQTIYANVDKNEVCHNALGVTLAFETKGTIIAVAPASDGLPTKYLVSWNGPVTIYAGPVRGEAYCWMHDYELALNNS